MRHKINRKELVQDLVICIEWGKKVKYETKQGAYFLFGSGLKRDGDGKSWPGI
jgi:hypothetical protein